LTRPRACTTLSPYTTLFRSDSSRKVRGQIVCAAGPWRASGDWWRADIWARDEWDVVVVDPASTEHEVLCRIFRDLSSEQWFVEGDRKSTRLNSSHQITSYAV